MSISPGPGPVATVIDRLRAAGCVYAEDEAGLLLAAADSPVDLERMVRRRCTGEPLEQVIGWAEFCGLRIDVEPGVFVPRRRTEFLVRAATNLLRPGSLVVDLCCGSGAVGAALRAAQPDIEVYAADIDPAAGHCAARNLGPDRVFVGDLYDALPDTLRGRLDVLAVNAPYVPSDSIDFMPPEARDHEPRRALDGGPDGLGVQRRVAARAPRWLAPGGYLLVETSQRQAPATLAAFAANGLAARVERSEEFDATVVVGKSIRDDWP